MGIALLPHLPPPRQKPRRELLTFEQFCDLVHENEKADLIEGLMYMQTPPTTLHELVFLFLVHLLDIFVREKELGVVLGSRTAARLGKHDGPEPDIMFVAKEREQIVRRAYVDGAPDLVVEIISPDTAYIDRKLKKKQYAKFGVREYWMINPDRLFAEFLHNHGGKWETMPLTAEGVFHSQVVSGFWLNVNWLWQEELPDPLETVMQILG